MRTAETWTHRTKAGTKLRQVGVINYADNGPALLLCEVEGRDAVAAVRVQDGEVLRRHGEGQNDKREVISGAGSERA